MQGLRQEALLKELRFSERMEDGLPLLPGDERLLQILVSNVVENAVKFTPKGGGVEIGVRAEDASLVLTVRDDGIGIPEEHRERIFDKFFTVSDGAATIPVRYDGLLPDLFSEGQGVIVEGVWRPGEAFEASRVLAKHDETYMPREVVEALKERGEWKAGE